MNDASDLRLVNTMSNMSTYKYYEALNFSEMNNGILQPGNSVDIVIGVGNTGGLKIPISIEYCRRSGCLVAGIYKIRLKRCGIKCCAHTSLTPFRPFRWRNSLPRHPSRRIMLSFIPAVNAPSMTLSMHATLRTGLPQTRLPHRYCASRSFCRLLLLYHVGSSVTSISPPHCAPST